MTEAYFTRDDRYLGDGVYVSHDGYHIWLDLRGQGDEGETRIGLEPSVLDALALCREQFRIRK
jgi:hypothetical protein